MKKFIAGLGCAIALTATVAWAGGNELAYVRLNELATLANGSVVAADFMPVYDTSVGKVRKVASTAFMSTFFEDTTATNTLTSDECGKTITLNSATEFVTTLPAPTAGCKFKFIIKAAPASASYTVVTNGSANVIIGGINELEVDTGDDGPYIADGDTITFADGVAVVGDYVDMVSDGTSWYITGQANADGGITLTQAS